MNKPFKDVLSLRERNRVEIDMQIKRAFNNREHDQDEALEEMVDAQSIQIDKAKSRNDGMIKFDKFEPRPSMAITKESHDYPYLLQKAWEKIQWESGSPTFLLNKSGKEYIRIEIARMLLEEQHHAVPIEGLETVERYFGVMFTEENGSYGIIPIMGFGGEMSLTTFGDIFTAPIQNSPLDRKIIEKIS